MPTYAYACKDCSHAFDIVQSFSDDALTECPQCQGRLRKKFGNVGVTFKGSGFYRTDSRGSSSSSTDSAKDSSSSAGDSASKSSESSGKSSESSSRSGGSSSAPKTPAASAS
ncbi:FmdB family zinc ribbon protein [Nesterenkonia muleiensis]|uniref:FmdB family zinc ribbon protein n=1 Tax=Nesterenkonia muleiensis TaxID=2282648 RepID=UPI000E712530|nr:FmdB family zinc ribbon protein [Nesterenkonia muleiensis]